MNQLESALPYCSDFQFFYGKERKGITARSMDFAYDVATQIAVYNREEIFQSQAPGNKVGAVWLSLYGCVALSAFGSSHIVDGMNEKGLTFAALMLSCTKYQAVPPQHHSKALAVSNLGLWILSQFKNIEEVEKGIKDVYVWEGDQPLGDVPGLHFALHDEQGGNLVIEYIDGQCKVDKSQANFAVLTNDTLSFQKEIIHSYGNLTASTPEAESGSPPGSGMMGLPGDGSSSSRAIRLGVVLRQQGTIESYSKAMSQALALLSLVTIPIGMVRVTCKTSQLQRDLITRWKIIRSPSKKRIYYSSFNDNALRLIKLKKIQFAKGTHHATIVLGNNPWQTTIDETDKFNKSSVKLN